MSVAFYSRYIPPRPQKVPVATSVAHSHQGEKRKRELNEDAAPKRQKTGRKRAAKTAVRVVQGVSVEASNGTSVSNQEKSKTPARLDDADVGGDRAGSNTSQNDAVATTPTKVKRGQDEKRKKQKRHRVDHGVIEQDQTPHANLEQQAQGSPNVPSADGDTDVINEDEISDTAAIIQAKKASKRKKRTETVERVEVGLNPEEEQTKKHSKILEKYSKSAQAAAPRTGAESKEHAPAPEEGQKLHDFGPIPRPAADPTYTSATSTYSALPSWLRSPHVVSSKTTASFSELSITPTLLATLAESGFTTALPVQAGVLPHVLPTIRQHPGDVCVSAATGSGKTLSYVLPILQDLVPTTPSKLRALIVVPTRELVDQVHRTFSLFSSSTALKVATAVGSHSLASEQSNLIEKRQRHDPEGWKRYKAFLDAPAYDSDADSVSSSSDFVPEDAFELSENHVPCFESRVDILITTPGRLVEHIRQTRGFTLSHLQWIVIDEADRLLDQSFQEWADVVNKALNKPSDDYFKNPFEGSDDPWLRTLLKPAWPGQGKSRPRKIICSASMTRDLEKLGSLMLSNPMSIVVEGGGKQVTTDDQATKEQVEKTASGALVLPAGLDEYAVPVGDGSEKPLYLLKLLEKLLARQSIHGTLKTNMPTSQPMTNGHTASTDTDTSSSSSSDDLSDSDSESISSDSSDSSNSSAPRQAKAIPNSSTQVATSAQPLVLLFTSTNSSAARLSSLMRHLSPTLHKLTTTLTKSTSASKTRKLLASFSTTDIASARAKRILIATDRASRGLDIPGLTDVMSYDVPRSVVSYVHRVGRTARAGKEGRAWTLLEGREAGWFWHVVAVNSSDPKEKRRKMGSSVDEDRIERGEGQKVRKVRLEDVKTEERVERYQGALEKLKEEVGDER